MTQISGGEAVIRALKAEGVDVVFGIPGVHALSIYDALYHHPEIRHIAVRHEQAAAYMADGYARVTGKPGVCITTTGPGAANTVAAMGTAYADSIPILNVMTQIESDLVDKGKGSLHEAKDQLGTFRSCTRWNTRVDTSEEVPAAIHDAFRQMIHGHPGPTAVEICADILEKRADVELFKFEAVAHPRKRETELKVRQAVEALFKARSPVLWVGSGAAMSNASDEVRRLAELLKAPVLTSMRGKGVIPEDHPLYIGPRATEPLVKNLLAEADVMLAVGTCFGYGSTANWQVKMPEQLIQIDLDEKGIGKNYPAALGLVGDAKAVLGQVIEGLGDLKADRPAVEATVAEVMKKSSEWASKQNPVMAGLMRDLRGVLPRDAVVVCDATKAANFVGRGFPVYEPRSYHFPIGYATLGFAFPVALGAKIGVPDRKVVAICGDGGFQFCLQELATAVQFEIDITVLIFNDQRWGVLRDLQDLHYGGRRYVVDLVNPDFVKLAEAYGANGLRVNDLSEFGSVVGQALSSGKITVVDIPMEVQSHPRVPSRQWSS
ncbi:MAG: thiamine pyrophosphate-binding protein [Dehalococcoidia bacterium]|nr:thiamine pyrophosphate-binding protein [Dehalococcoidia bacterium]